LCPEEETCITIELKQVLFVDEFFDVQSQLHKVKTYHTSDIKLREISSSCEDKGGV